ncbi:MAG: hypothetical protein OEM97_10855, partial [Acidimicrobiia bacterium]|nr:hypothetical protein [Acidimicrobiia bacterium]
QSVEMGASMNSAPFEVGQSISPQVESMVVRDMEDLGVEPAFIYAFQHTGLLVTDATIDGYSDQELMTWQLALDRYRRLDASAA